MDLLEIWVCLSLTSPFAHKEIIMDLKEILENSTYKILNGIYCVAKVDSAFKCDDIFMVSRDFTESTAIYKMGTAYGGIIEEKKNYKLIAMNVAVPFYAPGFIATISQSLARKSIPLLVVSTYSRDYFIVSTVNLEEAIIEIERLGIKQSKDRWTNVQP